MKVLHRHAIASVPEATESLNMCSVPDSVKEAEQLMQKDLQLKENLVNRITEAELNIDGLISSLTSQGVKGKNDVGASSGGTEDYGTMKDALSGMLQDMHSSLSQFDAFWTVHKARVDHMMRMCHFQKTASSVSYCGVWLYIMT